MAVEEFIDDGEVFASPIEKDDASVSELNITQLSLPDSFDESFCLDLYKEFQGQSRRDYKSDTTTEEARARVGSIDEPIEGTAHHNDLELREVEST